MEMWGDGPGVHPSPPTRSALEWAAVEGDSPVGEGGRGDARVPEYRTPDRVREVGGHRPPRLNTSRDR